MKMGIRIFFFIISLILYLYSPNEYDFKFCFWCMVLYLIEVGLCLKKEFSQGNFLSFNLIFFFSFFWTSFAYPVLVYDTPAGYLNKMIDHIDWSVLSHSTSLCLLFTSTYLLGFGSPKPIRINKVHSFPSSNGKSDALLKIVFVLLILMAFYYLVQAGFSYKDFAFDVAFWDLYFVLLAFCLIEHSKKKSKDCNFKEFYNLNKFPLFSAFFIVVLFLMFGDRGPVIKVLLVTGAIYNYYYRKIKFTQIAIVGMIGLVIMFFIRQTRGNDNLVAAASKSGMITKVFDLKDGAIYMFADLYGASMELNIAYAYKQNHPLYHPERIMAIPLTVVPFVPTIVLGILGTSMDEFNTGKELNRQMAQFNSQFGNHIVGDLYMSTGLVGVIIFSFILGFISKKLFINRFASESSAVAYMMLFALALYLPRDSLFNIVRPLALSYIVGALILKKKTKRTSEISYNTKHSSIN